MKQREMKFDYTSEEVIDILLFKLVQDDVIPGGRFTSRLSAERGPNDEDMKLTLSVTREG